MVEPLAQQSANVGENLNNTLLSSFTQLASTFITAKLSKDNGLNLSNAERAQTATLNQPEQDGVTTNSAPRLGLATQVIPGVEASTVGNVLLVAGVIAGIVFIVKAV